MRRRRAAAAGPAPDPSFAKGTDTLLQIQHIVVLMMENHSYDNYLGMLGRGDGFPLDAGGNPEASNVAIDGTVVPATRRLRTDQVKGLPLQAWTASHTQFGQGICEGFVRSVEEWDPSLDRAVPMSYWTESDIPFYYGLARTFPLADRWFSSCLGPTFPNRRFLIAGTAHGLIDDLPFGMIDYPPNGTIFDMLTLHGISWANYHNVPTLRVDAKRLLGKFGLKLFREIGLLIPPLRKFVLGNMQFTADLYPLGALGALNHLRPIKQFFADASAGTLPSVSIVDPDFGEWSEESAQDIQIGEGFAAAVINAVMAGPGWPRTLLIWTYDEHGGYYDHVPPPPAEPPDEVKGHSLLTTANALRWILRRFGFWRRLEKIDTGPSTYDRYGFRVPAVIVSPFSKPNFVASRTYDHTSILKLIERKWNLPPLTRRDALAVDPLEALSLETQPAFLEPPVLPAPARPWMVP